MKKDELNDNANNGANGMQDMSMLQDMLRMLQNGKDNDAKTASPDTGKPSDDIPLYSDEKVTLTKRAKRFADTMYHHDEIVRRIMEDNGDK